MVPVAELKDLKIFEAIASPTLNALSEDIVERSFGPGDFILHQHDEARAIYILLAGSVEFLMMIEGMEDLYVGETSEPGALIGWSVVREPFRFTASARCTEPSRVLKVPRDSLHRILKDDPTTGRCLVEAVAAALVERLDDARELLGRLPKSGPRLGD